MYIIELLRNIFDGLFLLSMITLFITCVLESKKREKKDCEKKDKIKWQDVVQIIWNLLIAVLGTSLICIIVSKQNSTIVTAGIVLVPMTLMILGESGIHIETVENIIKSRDATKLNFEEKISIVLLSYVLMWVQLFDLPKYILNIVPTCCNDIWTDLIIGGMYLIVFFLYIFTIFAMLSIPLFFVIKIFIKINEIIPVKESIKQCGNYFVDRVEKPIIRPRILIGTINLIIQKKIGIKIILTCIIPIILTIESIRSLFLFAWSMCVYIISYLIKIDRFLSKQIIKLFNWILGLSDRKLVGISFRMAIIVAFVILVASNQYETIFQLNGSSSTLEFLASAIIIPVIFEWIYSSRDKKCCS